MSTLLEFAIEQTLGQPTYRGNPGESYWLCPLCEKTKFHTMPTNPKFKHRFKCWSCGFRGDIHDWLLEVYPESSFTDRLDHIAQLKKQLNASRQHAEEQAVGSSSRGVGGQRDVDRDGLREALAEIFTLDKKQMPPMYAIAHAADIAQECGVSLNELATEVAGCLLSGREMVREHAKTCTDPLCGNECRQARGLEPLSDEVRAKLEAVEQANREREDRAKKARIDKAMVKVRGIASKRREGRATGGRKGVDGNEGARAKGNSPIIPVTEPPTPRKPKHQRAARIERAGKTSATVTGTDAKHNKPLYV